MAEIEQAFGQTLRVWRKRRQLSQEDLGLDAGLSRNYISQLELGGKSPSLRTLFQLCQVLQVQPSVLIQDVEQRLLPSPQSST